MSRWISARAQKIEERYNMLHGDHGLFAVGEGLDTKLKDLTPAQRDLLAQGVTDCSQRLHREADTQGRDAAKTLHAVADKVADAGANIRDGNFTVAKKELTIAAVDAATAGYPGVAQQVTSVGSNWVNQFTGEPLIPRVDDLLDKNNGNEPGHEDLPKSGYLSGIDFGTLG